MSPDECSLKSHLIEAPFLSGVDAGKWGLCGEIEAIVWPTAIFWVQSEHRFMPAGRIFLKFNLQQYPQNAPTACPWDNEKNTRLDSSLWPKISGNMSGVFNPNWNPCALYAPCDRIAMQGHHPWREKFPLWWWQSNFTIVRYLEFVHQCLNPAHEN
jgi:hypothetical protein